MAKHKCVISIDLEAVKKIRVVEADEIVIDGKKVRRKGGWTLAQIIEYSAFKGPQAARAKTHSAVYVESIKVYKEDNGYYNAFELEYGT
jgi:ribosomal protein L13